MNHFGLTFLGLNRITCTWNCSSVQSKITFYKTSSNTWEFAVDNNPRSPLPETDESNLIVDIKVSFK